MAKFFFYEKTVQLFYTHVFTEPKETYSKSTQLGFTFASGYLAGVVCAIVSHPADSLVSLLGKPSNKGKSIGQIASETGIANLATKGLGTRVIMIGTITGKHPSSYALCLCLISYSRLPVVDLRLFQGLHGPWYDWWKVIAHLFEYATVIQLRTFRVITGGYYDRFNSATAPVFFVTVIRVLFALCWPIEHSRYQCC